MPPTITKLAAALNDTSSDIREQAILDLQGFGQSALPLLISALSAACEDVRWRSLLPAGSIWHRGGPIKRTTFEPEFKSNGPNLTIAKLD